MVIGHKRYMVSCPSILTQHGISQNGPLLYPGGPGCYAYLCSKFQLPLFLLMQEAGLFVLGAWLAAGFEAHHVLSLNRCNFGLSTGCDLYPGIAVGMINPTIPLIGPGYKGRLSGKG